MPNDKGIYETFDSGGGPTVPEGHEKDFAHADSDGGLDKSGAESAKQLDVPAQPQKKG